MRIICDALEKEGFGPSQVSADEAIRHLWWQKENHRTSPGQPTEKEAVDFSKIFQVQSSYLASWRAPFTVLPVITV